MLRTTFSRIRKVCAVAFIPRILRGDQYNAAVSSVIRKAHKTTKSTDDGEKASTEKSNDVPNYTFSSAAELKIDDTFRKKISSQATNQDDRTAIENEQATLSSKLPLTHRERCQRIIDQAFGKADSTQSDRMLGEQYFSHNVNLDDTRRAIHESEKAKLKLQEQQVRIDDPLLPDDRSQYSIFKMSRELNFKDDTRDEITISDSASARQPDLTKNLENVKGTAEETASVEEPNLSQAKEDADKYVNNPETIAKKALCVDDAETIEVVKDERKPDLYQKLTPTYQPHVPWFLNATTAREPKLTYAKEDVNECANNQENVENKTLCDDNAEAIKLVKDERKDDLHLEATPKDQPQVLNATTAKNDEELLTQKLETIEETPIVEAQKPDLEGFNVTPRVLGNEPSLNYKIKENNQDLSSKEGLPGTLDEVSKRCLNCPLGQIDEMLINEMEKLGMTCRTAQKAPSTSMEDDLVQMDVLNKNLNKTIEEQEIHSESIECEENENERAADAMISDVNEQTEALRISEKENKITEEDVHDVSYPDHIRIQLNPIACKSEVYNPAEDSTAKFTSHYLPPYRAANANTQEIEETIPNRRAPIYEQIEEPFSLHEPLHKAPLSETPNSRNVISNQNAELHYTRNVFATAQNAQTESAAAEAEKTSVEDINSNVTPVDPLNDASDNITRERLLKPEYNSYSNKGVEKPSYYSTINASKYVGSKNRTPAERGLDNNSLNTRNLAVANVWGLSRNESASKNRNVLQNFPMETDQVEHYGQTPISQSTTKMQGGLEEEDQTKANRLSVKAPYTDFSLSGENWENEEMEHLPIADKITQQCSNKLYSAEKSETKPEQDSENVSLPEEILKQHTLDPYYVIACNETCPISPVTVSVAQNSDFVDTTETLYMKKNICESVRPKPQPIVNYTNMSSATQAHPNELNMAHVPEPMPENKEQITLSELLRRTRERSRLAYCSEAKSKLDVQAVGKCGKSPRCMPTGPRSPPNDPVPPPGFGLPKLKRRPPVCKPKKKPSTKCSCATNEECFPEMAHYELDEADLSAIRSKVNLTDEVMDRLQNLGMILGRVLRQSKSNVETLLARDYEPWAPIPSWKIPQKSEKKTWQPGGSHGLPPCVDGCPVFPKARASMNPEPPCNLKPCRGFPKRRSFSMLDCFTVSLGENKVYDLGDF